MKKKKRLNIPADVPLNKASEYKNNLNKLTKNTGKLMLFAGDQKIEHLNKDFYGKGIAEEDNNPEHLFRIASKATIGGFATQYGMIAHYGRDYKNIEYIVKLNSKTNLVKTRQKDPLSTQLITLKQVMELKKSSRLNIRGVGYTVYLGSEYESIMLKEAANIIHEAHQNGLITILWIYPRGDAVKDEKDPHLIAGATGTACCLGADFVKVNYPKATGKKSEELLKEAIESAGRCGVICAGGSSTDPKKFLEKLWKQLNISGASGNATGRNVHQKPLKEAVRMCNAISAITFKGKSVNDAMKIYNG
tara:strand:+ start:4163 stop:5077 length:915 start_codon:yes stop_codon:yes gene_type:complete